MVMQRFWWPKLFEFYGLKYMVIYVMLAVTTTKTRVKYGPSPVAILQVSAT